MPNAYALPRSVRWFAASVAAIVWLSLVLQFVLVMTQADALGISKAEALLAYFSFFTLQTNILAAVVTTLAAAGSRLLPGRSRIKPAIVVYLVTGGAIFFLALRDIWSAHYGLQWITDILLHCVTPVLYAIFWLVAVPKAGLRWRDAAIWLIYPFLYLVVVLVLAQRSGFYPYPFLDLRALSVTRMAMNMAFLAASFLCGGLVVVAIGRSIQAGGTVSD